MEIKQDHMLSLPEPDREQTKAQFFNHSLSQNQTRNPPYAPPAYSQTRDLPLVKFPDVSTTELPPIQPAAKQSDHDQVLPSLSSVTGPQNQRFSPPQSTEDSTSRSAPVPANCWPSVNPLTAHYTQGHVQAAESPGKMDVDTISSTAASPDRYHDGRGSSVSLDDPDVRLAAEALGDLRADFVSSPPHRNTSLPASPPSQSAIQCRNLVKPQRPQPEPLLQLLTTSHPLLATTIRSTTSAYNNSKNYSPRFKSSAEYVEGYVTPIANTIGSVSRVTGVEGSVRWFLGEGRRHPDSPSDLEAGEEGSNKRRKVESGPEVPSLEPRGNSLTVEVVDSTGYPFALKQDRRLSTASTIDTLPPYDDENRSPAYTEEVQPLQRPTSANAAWQSRLITSTSGLSVAMSEESLRSLKYCLRWLRWANDHIGKIISTLKTTLDQYDNHPEQAREARGSGTSADSNHIISGQAEHCVKAADRSELVARIASLKTDVIKTLKDVIDTVSRYAGGALPENARALVHRHLTSLPRRFQVASMMEKSQQSRGESSGEGEMAQEKATRDGAKRVLVLALEGLDMVAQVSGVLDGTIVSAEEWCERLGKRKKEEREALLPRDEISSDVKTG